MGKISPVSSKYIINASLEIEGVVDKPDVIGAVFGQTEGLLGAELELRELQRSGRIGRIEVNSDTRGGKTIGSIVIPSSLDKAETSIVAAALEIIQRIGPCNAKIKISNIEDIRVSKRSFVVERAKELLRNLMDGMMPDSQELAEEVAQSVRVTEIAEYGRDRLPAGPAIEESDEIVVVEGRADVVNLLKHGFKNCIAINGTSMPPSIIDLSRKKEVTVFVDGDRGGSLIVKELLVMCEIDYVTRAPDGKEVEELTKKEIHKALRSKITVEQAKLEMAADDTSNSIRRPVIMRPVMKVNKPVLKPLLKPQEIKLEISKPEIKLEISVDERNKFSDMLEHLVGTRGAYILDNKLSILGKVPNTELVSTLKSLNSGVYAVVFDGVCDKTLADAAEISKVRHIVSMDSKVSPTETRVNVVTAAQL